MAEPQDPFAPPRVQDGTPAPDTDYVLAPLDNLVRLTTIFLKIAVALGTFSIFSSLSQIDLLQRLAAGKDVMPHELDASDAVEGAIGLAEFVVLVATWVLFCILLPRANRNIRALGDTHLRFSPGGTIWWFFVPIANLWKPFQAMRELWIYSHPDSEVRSQQRSTMLMPLWWITWLAGLSISSSAFRLLMSDDPSQLIEAHRRVIVGDIFEIPCAIFVMLIIHAIGRNQKQRALHKAEKNSTSPFPML